MKRKIKLMLVTVLMICGLFSTQVFAGNSSDPNEVFTVGDQSSATMCNWNTEYTANWGGEISFKAKVVLEKNGALKFDVTKPVHPNIGTLQMDIQVYDAAGDIIWKVRSKGDTDKASYQVYLKAGTYYARIIPQYSSFADNTKSTIMLSFEEKVQTEFEYNNTKETATPIEVDTWITGQLGSGFGITSGLQDNIDVYQVTLTKGKVYNLQTIGFQGTTIACIAKKDEAVDEYDPMLDDVTSNEAFIAPYTGEYYVGIYNYIDAPYEYQIKMENIVVPKVKLKSVSKGRKSFTAKWKNVKCDGYQIQYSTSKKMKGAKSKYVSKSSTKKITIKKLKSGKKYYVRIRSYKKVGKKKAYSAWSKAISVKTK